MQDKTRAEVQQTVTTVQYLDNDALYDEVHRHRIILRALLNEQIRRLEMQSPDAPPLRLVSNEDQTPNAPNDAR